MRHLDLFSGIGAFALAASWVWPEHEVAAFCEIDEDCRRVLAKHWPEVPVVEDIRDLDGRGYADVDLLTGGFPCTPFSSAGRRGGTQDDRYLWPEMLRVIREVRPAWVVAENVADLASMELESRIPKVESRTILRTPDYDLYRGILSREEIMLLYALCDELEAEGYEAQPLIIPACGVGAPHRRRRLWIVAHADCERQQQSQGVSDSGRRRSGDSGENVADASRKLLDGCGCAGANGRSEDSDRRDVGDSERQSLALGQGIGRGIRAQQPPPERASGTNGSGSAEPRLGRSANGPTAWMDGSWERGIPRTASGVANRASRLRALGNAIVPQVAAEIFKAIKKADTCI